MKNKIIKSLALVFLALTIVTNGVHIVWEQPHWGENSNCIFSDGDDNPIKGDIYPSN